MSQLTPLETLKTPPQDLKGTMLETLTDSIQNMLMLMLMLLPLLLLLLLLLSLLLLFFVPYALTRSPLCSRGRRTAGAGGYNIETISLLSVF